MLVKTDEFPLINQKEGTQCLTAYFDEQTK